MLSMKLMRVVPGVLVAALAAAIAMPAPARAEVRKGDRASEFTRVVDARGKRVELKTYTKDCVVVLTFGASWCGPCAKELPALDKVALKYKGKRVAFLAVNIDSEQGKGEKFMKRLGLKRVRALYDKDQGTVERYAPPKMPSTFIIRNGIVQDVHTGYEPGDESKLDRLVADELGKLKK